MPLVEKSLKILIHSVVVPNTKLCSHLRPGLRKTQCSKCRVAAPGLINVHARITLISITQLRDVKRVRHQK